MPLSPLVNGTTILRIRMCEVGAEERVSQQVRDEWVRVDNFSGLTVKDQDAVLRRFKEAAVPELREFQGGIVGGLRVFLRTITGVH